MSVQARPVGPHLVSDEIDDFYMYSMYSIVIRKLQPKIDSETSLIASERAYLGVNGALPVLCLPTAQIKF
jgi:hypothetical protein